MKHKEMEKLLNAMAHAFYQVHDCLENNLPDYEGDEYAEECLTIYEESFEEFKDAEETMRKLFNVEQ